MIPSASGVTAGGLWLRGGSRYAGWPQRRARIALALVALLLAATLSILAAPSPPQASKDPAQRPTDRADMLLYEEIAQQVRHGDDYYLVTADKLRRGDYPLRPFVTFRLPTLAVIMAWLPAWLVQALLWALAAAVALVWALRLRPAFARGPPFVIALVLLAGGMTVFVQTDLVAMHELWAGLLIALSLGVWRPARWLEAVALGLAAMLIRETAGLYCGLMLLFALTRWRQDDRAKREAIGWLVALVVMGIAVAAHAHAVAQVVRPSDPASQGWSGLLGFGFFVRTATIATALALFPAWAGALLVGLALFGWTAWREAVATRVVAMLVAYAVLIAVAGRVDTFYWALLAAPLLLVGLAFAPDGIADLIRAAAGKRRYTVTRSPR